MPVILMGNFYFWQAKNDQFGLFYTIGDVANWKRHQRLDEILIFFFTHTTSEKSAKLFSKKLCHAIRARFIQRKLVINVHVSDIVFLQTTLQISCIVWVKIIKISSSHWWLFEFATSAILIHFGPL